MFDTDLSQADSLPPLAFAGERRGAGFPQVISTFQGSTLSVVSERLNRSTEGSRHGRACPGHPREAVSHGISVSYRLS
jgi:hypothetical protein